MEYKKFASIRFCIRQTKMAFETPFVPRRLHFKFGPSGVKVNKLILLNFSKIGSIWILVQMFGRLSVLRIWLQCNNNIWNYHNNGFFIDNFGNQDIVQMG